MDQFGLNSFLQLEQFLHFVLDYQKEMIVGENINQQIIFNSEIGFKKVRFLYPQADIDKDLTIYANIIDPAYYEMKIFLNNFLVSKANL